MSMSLKYEPSLEPQAIPMLDDALQDLTSAVHPSPEQSESSLLTTCWSESNLSS